jgi:NCS2 family nucleobase:cation symporter-2
MARKPTSMHYLADDIPPTAVTLVNALQYVAVTSGFLVFPLIVARASGASTEATDGVMSWSMLVLAVGSVLQALPRGPVGSGYVAPATTSAIFLGPSLQAVHLGGIALMSGMTIFSGLIESLVAPFLNRLRSVLPPELAGLVIFLVGISNGMVGVRYLLLTEGGGSPGAADWVVAAIALVVMVSANVWSRGVLGLTCALAGMAAGYGAALATGVLPAERVAEVAALPWLAAPRISQIGWSFSPALVLPFLIAALANTLKAAALLTASQRLLDADWARPDLAPISRGVLADGLTTMFSGLVSVFGVNVSASSVGLTAATGVASRRVAYATGAVFCVLAFLPMVTRLLALMPPPLVGATLVFTACAVLKNGMETIAARLGDTRRSLAVGLAILAGLAVEAFPSVFRGLPTALQPIMGSSLVLGTLVGFTLNLIFSVGTRRRDTLVLDPTAPDLLAARDFVTRFGARVGARRDIVGRAEYAVQELVDTIAHACAVREGMRLSAGFDEFNLDIDLRYVGDAFEVSRTRPTFDELADGADGARRLAGFLLRHAADRVSTSRRDGAYVVRLHFDH